MDEDLMEKFNATIKKVM